MIKTLFINKTCIFFLIFLIFNFACRIIIIPNITLERAPAASVSPTPTPEASPAPSQY